jgi:UDP-3-O-[3-hydroxymyristoyl] N-acetylglucosamine deacetylase
MEFQATIKRAVEVEGIGLHTGGWARLALAPAPAGAGIVFRGPDGTLVPANAAHVVDSHHATTVGAFGVKIRTIEHLMAAVAAFGIDNLLIDVDGDEVPAMDGSARPFVDLLRAAGRTAFPVPRRRVVVGSPIRVGDESRWIQVVPADVFRITYTLENSHPAIGLQALSLEVSEDSFVEELAAARTYGFLRDVPLLRKHGLARGGSLDNAIVVGKRSVLNESLRWSDEFVRHKALDLVGDLGLLGGPLVGHVVARNAGHALNYQLVVAIQQALGPQRRLGPSRAAGADHAAASLEKAYTVGSGVAAS